MKLKSKNQDLTQMLHDLKNKKLSMSSKRTWSSWLRASRMWLGLKVIMVAHLTLWTLWPSTNSAIPFDKYENKAGGVFILFHEKYIPEVLKRVDLYPELRANLGISLSTLEVYKEALSKSQLEIDSLRSVVSNFDALSAASKVEMDKKFFKGVGVGAGLVAVGAGILSLFIGIGVSTDKQALAGILAGSGLILGGGVLSVAFLLPLKKG